MRTSIAQLLATDLVVARADHPELANALDWLRRRRELVAVLPGVYARAGTELLFEVRLAALRAWDRDAIVTGWAAARSTFWPGPAPRAVTAAVAHRRSAQPGFAFSRRRIDPDLIDETTGLRLTVPALTAVDLCVETDGGSIDRALRLRAASLHELRRALIITAHRRGNRDRHRLLLESRAEPWSAAERRCHQLFRAARITGWRANLEVVACGHRYFIDIAFASLKLAVEIDGREFHGDDEFESDRHRQNALVLEGWVVLRFTWAMLVDEPERVVREVRAMIAALTRSTARLIG